MKNLGGKDFSGRECALIACCEEDDMSVIDGVRVPIERGGLQRQKAALRNGYADIRCFRAIRISDADYFCAVFRSYESMTPVEYRKTYGK